MVFNTIFNNISVISWWSVLLVEETTDLSQVTDSVSRYLLALQNKVIQCTFKYIISSLGHRPCELLSWVRVRRPSVSFSHLNLLL